MKKFLVTKVLFILLLFNVAYASVDYYLDRIGNIVFERQNTLTYSRWFQPHIRGLCVYNNVRYTHILRPARYVNYDEPEISGKREEDFGYVYSDLTLSRNTAAKWMDVIHRDFSASENKQVGEAATDLGVNALGLGATRFVKTFTNIGQLGKLRDKWYIPRNIPVADHVNSMNYHLSKHIRLAITRKVHPNWRTLRSISDPFELLKVYTDDALDVYNTYRKDRKKIKHITLSDGTPAIKIKTSRTGRGGIYVKHPTNGTVSIVTFWYNKG